MACILNTIPNFHALEGCVPDIMHIFLEGVCHLILKVLLIYIICTQRYISIEIFNSRLSALDFGHCDSTNIPTPLKVLRSDERWCHFMTLLFIMELVFSSKITRAMIEQLPEMVESFLETYKKLYGQNITPKMHYMCHLHSWMKKYVNETMFTYCKLSYHH